jgi:hypothetical protein
MFLELREEAFSRAELEPDPAFPIFDAVSQTATFVPGLVASD